MKSRFQKLEAVILNNRNYKYSKNDNFRNDLLHEINKRAYNVITSEEFESLFMATLNKPYPLED